MSYRSSLSIPETSSGAVGTVYSAVVSTVAVAIGTGVVSPIASIVVPAGVYSVDCLVNITIDNATTVSSAYTYILSAPAGSGAFTTYVTSVDIATAVAFTTTALEIRQIGISKTITLTAPTILYGAVGFNFTGGGISSDQPINTTVPYTIQAIKLA